MGDAPRRVIIFLIHMSLYFPHDTHDTTDLCLVAIHSLAFGGRGFFLGRHGRHKSRIFDSTLGYPGEGPAGKKPSCYTLHLTSERLFQQVNDREKVVDGRIKYDSLRQIKLGDILELRYKNRVVYRRCVQIHEYSGFEIMLRMIGVKVCLPHFNERDIDGATKFYHSFPDYEELAKTHGVIAFRLGTILVPSYHPWNRIAIKNLTRTLLLPDDWLVRIASGTFARVYRFKHIKKLQQQIPQIKEQQLQNTVVRMLKSTLKPHVRQKEFYSTQVIARLPPHPHILREQTLCQGLSISRWVMFAHVCVS